MLPEIFTASEVVSLVLSLLVVGYVLLNIKVLRGSTYNMIIMSLCCIASALFITNLEEIFLPDFLNVVEHTLFTAGAFLVAIGCRRYVIDSKKNRSEQR